MIDLLNEAASYFWQEFQTNDFMSAAVLAAPLTFALYALRSLPLRLFELGKRWFTLEVRFNSDNPDYKAIQTFIMRDVVRSQWSRRFTFQSEVRWDAEEGEEFTTGHAMVAGYGAHWGMYKGCPVIIERQLEEGNQTSQFKERLILTFVSRSQKVVDRFADDLKRDIARDSDDDYVGMNVNDGQWWRAAGRLPLRLSQTVISDGVTEEIVASIRQFEDAKERYRAKGMPYHVGVLLHGPPGTGKTSIIHAVASELGRSIYYLNLGSLSSDKQLMALVSGAQDWRKRLLVIEDTDAGAGGALQTREGAPQKSEGNSETTREQEEPLSLSAMLNVLDGLLSPDGLVVIATTNHPERLDPAMLRPGRFDLNFAVGPLSWEGFERLVHMLVDDPDPRDVARLKASYEPTTGAVCRQMLMGNNLETAISYFEKPDTQRNGEPIPLEKRAILAAN